MPGSIKRSFNGLRGALKYFFLELLGTQSTRIQLIWFSAFSWATTHLYFGALLPWMREFSIIYYRQNGIKSLPIDLNSPYAQTILNSTDMAFMAIVAGYVASSWNRYKQETVKTNITEKGTNKAEEEREDK